MTIEQTLTEDLSISYHPTGFTIKEYGYSDDDREIMQVVMLDHDQADKLWRFIKDTLTEVGFYE